MSPGLVVEPSLGDCVSRPNALVQSPAPFKPCIVGYSWYPSTHRVEAEGDIRSSRSTWVTKRIQGQSGLYKTCLRKKKKIQKPS